jgi:hypothetical protein
MAFPCNGGKASVSAEAQATQKMPWRRREPSEGTEKQAEDETGISFSLSFFPSFFLPFFLPFFLSVVCFFPTSLTISSA